MATRLLLDEEPLVILPSLAAAIGLNESIVLQQLHYWLERSTNVHEGHTWVYNTYEEWKEQFPFWSESTIRRIITKLEKQELIITGNFNRSKIDKTKWYRINYEKLARLQDEQSTAQPDTSTVQNEQTTDEIDSPSVQNEQSICSNWTDDLLNLNRPIPEITTENTTDINKEVVVDTPVRESMNPFLFFEQNGFGVIGSYIGEKISNWIADTSEELVLEAMKIAVENGVKTWKYVESILRDWSEKGYRTVEQIRAAQMAFKEQQAKKRNGSGSVKQRRPVRTEMIPDWLGNINYDVPESADHHDSDVERRRRELEERLKKYKDTNGE
ncbi:DnaD domain-containing protein [Parageobacillus toebii]|uniref:DnaD domain-containing protein n=1 Tax=Parageobacillus toebii TaxID=153151 RepID=UPI002815148B|nr:DnaD domain protein [Parageobacillus toebii]WMT19174.1 DnaD domain protein [Parageobacillus toebii]